jgi:amphi-Trp domain-containing protein
MGREVVLFKTEERMDRQHIAAFLHQLADKVADGTVTLRSGAESITLTLPHMLTLEVKVEDENRRSGLKHSLEVELEWRAGDDTAAGGIALA